LFNLQKNVDSFVKKKTLKFYRIFRRYIEISNIHVVKCSDVHSCYSRNHVYETRVQSRRFIIAQTHFSIASECIAGRLRHRPSRRETILDPLLKDASAFPGVPYKEFNSSDSSTVVWNVSQVTLRSPDR